MGADTVSKSGRRPNVQPNNHLPSIHVEFSLDGKVIGSVKVKQDPFLSKSGNVLYFARVREGWKLPEGALEAMTVKVNGTPANVASTGIHLTAPRKDKSGNARPGTGGEKQVCFTTSVETVEGDEDSDPQILNTFITALKPKNGADRGHSLRVASMPRGTGVSGEQVVGLDEVEGLLIVE